MRTTSQIASRTNSVRVEGDAVGQARREAFSKLLHGGARALHHLHGIGVGVLVDSERRRGPAVEARPDAVLLGAEFDSGDVAHPHHRAVGIGPQQDVGEFLGLEQAPLRDELQLKGCGFAQRLLAENAGRDLRVLLLDRRGDGLGTDRQRLHLHRVEPDAHGVAHVGKVHDAPHPLDPSQRLDHLRLGPVREEQLIVVGAVLGVEDDIAEALPRALRNLEALRPDSGRQLGLRTAGAGEHLGSCRVQIRSDREGGVDADAAVGAAHRVDVEEVRCAVHLLLDWNGDGLVRLLGAGAGVGRLDVDDRRRDLGILRDRKGQARDDEGRQKCRP